jgi:AmiR/NasT family two-component response regulator
LKEALRTRDMIGQAKGILMAREGLDEDAAFRLLIRASQRTNAKLRDVARKVVESAAREHR